MPTIDPVTGLTEKEKKPEDIKVRSTTLDPSFLQSGLIPQRTHEGTDVGKYEKYVPGGSLCCRGIRTVGSLSSCG